MSWSNEHRLVYLPLFILNLRLDVVDSIRGLDLEGDGLAGKSLNEDLHAYWMLWWELRMKGRNRKSGFISCARRRLK